MPLPLTLNVLTNGKVIIDRVALAVYVDDLLIAGKDEVDILHIKELLKVRFEVKDLGEVQMILGIRVKWYNQQITLDQSQYTKVILRQFLNNASPPYLIPMEPNIVYRLADTRGEVLNEEKRSRYLQVIRKLMYLCYTRPDVIFSVHKLAQFSLKPYAIHESALHRVFRCQIYHQFWYTVRRKADFCGPRLFHCGPQHYWSCWYIKERGDASIFWCRSCIWPNRSKVNSRICIYHYGWGSML